MKLILAKLAMTAGLVAATATLSFGQTGTWHIDSAHSTARFSVVSSNNSTAPVDIAIAKVTGSVSLDESRNDESKNVQPSLRLTIYPAGQESSLLNPDGSLRNGALAALPSYTVMSFQSKSAVVNREGEIEFTGDLTLVHVQRETTVPWNIGYDGSVPTEPVANTMTREVTFIADLSNLIFPAGRENRSAEITAQAIIQRNNFPGLVAALRDSNWPVVVLDEECQMPYYPALTARDYNGPSCSGMPIERGPHPAPPPPYNFVPNSVGTAVPVPPTGDRVRILAHLRLQPAVSSSIPKP